jgi:hypothetical protein
MSHDDGAHDPGEDAARPRAVTKVGFYGGVIVAAGVLTILESLPAAEAARRLGFRDDHDFLFHGLFLMNYGLCYAAADWLLKWLGLSRSGRVVEGRARGPAPLDEGNGEAEVVEVFWLDSPGKGIAWAILAIMGLPALGVLVARLVLLPRDRNGVLMALGLAALNGLLALNFWLMGRRLRVRVDALGIAGYPMKGPSRRQFIPWEDVATCEIVTTHDPMGEPVLICPVLKDAKGAQLLELNLKAIPMPDQERLVQYIRLKLPKAVIDPWEEAV